MIASGLVSATFRSKRAEEVLALCARNRLSAIEWSENAHVMPGDPSGAAELARATADAGVAVAAYGSYYRLGTAAEIEPVFRASLDSAAGLGAPLIRVWAGTKGSAALSEAEFEAIAAEARLIARIAAEEGIAVAFEWHKDTLTDTNESALRLLAAADHANLYCLWQPTVALSEAERVAGLELLGDRLLNLHVYHWASGLRRPLAEGKEAWAAYFSRVDASRDRRALLEFVMNDSEEQLAEDAATLAAWLDAINGRGPAAAPERGGR